MSALFEENEKKVSANYAACVERFKSEGHTLEEIEHWSDFYLDYMGGPVQNPEFHHEDDDEWDELMH